MAATLQHDPGGDPHGSVDRGVSIRLIVTKRGEGSAIILTRMLNEAGYRASHIAVPSGAVPTGPAIGVTDVVVIALDVLLPVTRRRRRWLGERARTSRIVLMADSERALDTLDLIDLADGVVISNTGQGRIVSAIEVAMAGYMILPPELATLIRQEHLAEGRVVRLTPQQRLVLAKLAQGLGNRQIADDLGIDQRQVQTMVRAVLARLRLPNRTRAALFAIEHGLVSHDLPEDRGCS